MSNRRFAVAPLVALLAFAPTTLKAEFKRYCKVHHLTRAGWSEGYVMEVSFLTGYELGKRLNAQGYNYADNFAMFWFAQDEVAIIKLDAQVTIGLYFKPLNFRGGLFSRDESIRGTQVNAPTPRQWMVVAREGLTWVDERGPGYP